MALSSSASATQSGDTPTTLPRTTTTLRTDVTSTTVRTDVTTTTRPPTTPTTIPPAACKIGDIGPGGGRVFYVSITKINVQRGISKGGRCLEAAPKTWAGTAKDPTIGWGCDGTLIGGTSFGIGAGASNTAKIMAGCATSGIAPRRAANSTFGGKSDWFLPSKAELSLMYTNLKSATPSLGGFKPRLYRSSSESGASYAWSQSFYDGSQYSSNKFISHRVRVIRAFG